MRKKLKLAIIERFETQADFAQELGIQESLVSRVIRGRRALSNDELQRWTSVLGINQKDMANE